MGRKVLIVSSSPRVGGNTDTLCGEFAKGAMESGHAVERVSLVEKKVGFCHACYACQGGGTCPQKDDGVELVGKLLAADVIVLATPVYFYTMCAQLKALIDRCVMAYPNLKEKEFYFIMTMADRGKEHLTGTIEALKGFVECCEGSTIGGMVCGEGFYEKGTVCGQPICKEAYEMGKNVK